MAATVNATTHVSGVETNVASLANTMAHANGDAIPSRTTGDEGIATPVLLVEDSTEAVLAPVPGETTTAPWGTAIN